MNKDRIRICRWPKLRKTASNVLITFLAISVIFSLSGCGTRPVDSTSDSVSHTNSSSFISKVESSAPTDINENNDISVAESVSTADCSSVTANSTVLSDTAYRFYATVKEIDTADSYLMAEVTEIPDDSQINSFKVGDEVQVNLPVQQHTEAELKVGDVVGISFDGFVVETYPCQIDNVYSIKTVPQETIQDSSLFYGVYWTDEYKYVGPELILYPDGHGDFTIAPASSDIPMGKYEIANGNIVLTDDNDGRIFTFRIDGDRLIFCADQSAELYDYGYGTAKDGMIFTYCTELSDHYLSLDDNNG